MDQSAIALRAGWTRAVMAVLGLTILPVVFPPLAKHAPVFWGYLAFSLLVQLAIKKQLGGNVRVFLGGVVDLMVLTYFVHRLGTGSSPAVSIYLLIGVLNTMAVGLRQGQILALLGFLTYLAVVVLEQRGALPYAPDPPEWGAPRPDLSGALMIAVMTGVLLFISTYIVGVLVEMVRKREKELLHANVLLEELSQKDSLTQLFNRRHLVSRIEHELARVRRGRAFSLLMIDLDGLKRVNDERGHLAGDDALRGVARALERTTRATDIAGRYGGDEFLVLLTDTDREDAEKVGGRLVDGVREAADRAEDGPVVTASVGLAVARAGDDVRALLRRADQCCYEAKQAGGNRLRTSAG